MISFWLKIIIYPCMVSLKVIFFLLKVCIGSAFQPRFMFQYKLVKHYLCVQVETPDNVQSLSLASLIMITSNYILTTEKIKARDEIAKIIYLEYQACPPPTLLSFCFFSYGTCKLLRNVSSLTSQKCVDY